MAVFTQLDKTEIATFLDGYNGTGILRQFSAIAEGVENSNYLLELDGGRFVLTLYEQRAQSHDADSFLNLMDYLHKSGFRVPPVMRREDGALSTTLADKPASLMGFLEGTPKMHPNPQACQMAGAALAKMHVLARNVSMPEDVFSPAKLESLYQACREKGGAVPEAETMLKKLAAQPTESLPQGVLHADLFPDNVLFDGDNPGFIDFCFACRGLLAYDLGICLNAWCFEEGVFSPAHARAMLAGYQSQRTLEEAEKTALPLLAGQAALRFYLTRLEDVLTKRMEASGLPAKNPAPFLERLKFWLNRLDAPKNELTAQTPPAKVLDIWTDGACSGNPGPGGWGVVIRAKGEDERRLSGYEQETTNNRMELLAAIRALEEVPEGGGAHLHTDSTYVRDGITRWIKNWKRNGWRVSGSRKQVKNQDLWEQLDALASARKIHWHWVRGHEGNEGNEAADALARAAIWQR